MVGAIRMTSIRKPKSLVPTLAAMHTSATAWPTVKAILETRDGPATTDEALTKVSFARLKPSTEQQALRIHKMQQTPEPAEA